MQMSRHSETFCRSTFKSGGQKIVLFLLFAVWRHLVYRNFSHVLLPSADFLNCKKTQTTFQEKKKKHTVSRIASNHLFAFFESVRLCGC